MPAAGSPAPMQVPPTGGTSSSCEGYGTLSPSHALCFRAGVVARAKNQESRLDRVSAEGMRDARPKKRGGVSCLLSQVSKCLDEVGGSNNGAMALALPILWACSVRWKPPDTWCTRCRMSGSGTSPIRPPAAMICDQ